MSFPESLENHVSFIQPSGIPEEALAQQSSHRGVIAGESF